ncbi:MDR family MFS transporter [Chitinophagaceae bacterium MMS25-I14]
MNRALQLYKSAYGGLSSSTWLLSLVMLVNRCGTMVVPFMTLYLTESMHVSIGKAGFVMALFGAGAVCGGFIGGRLTDRIGFYYIQLCTLVGGGIMFLVLGQMRSYPLICVATFLLSIINESFRPANSAAIAHYSKAENTTRSYSLNRLAINLGWALGGSLGGFIASKNYHLLFWIDGGTNIFAALLLWLFLAPSKNKATRKKHIEVPAGDVRSAYHDKPYLVFIFLTMLFAYCFFQLFSTIPVYYKEGLHMSEKYIGGVMAMNGILIAVLEMVTVFKMEGRRENLHFIFYGVLFVAASFCVFNLLPQQGWLAVVSMLIVTVGEIFSMPFMNSFWTSRSTPVNRGQYAGLYTVAWSSAQVLGPGTGAWVAEKMGFTFLWWMITVLCIMAACGYKWLQWQVEKRNR